MLTFSFFLCSLTPSSSLCLKYDPGPSLIFFSYNLVYTLLLVSFLNTHEGSALLLLPSDTYFSLGLLAGKK
jgi:hypothetical protein